MKKLVCMFLIGIMVVTSSGCGSQKETNDSNQSAGGQQTETESSTNTGTQVNSGNANNQPVLQEKAKISLGNNIEINGKGVQVQENIISISEGGAYEFSGNLTDGMIYVETEDVVKLILNGANITSKKGPAIYVYNAEEVWIETQKGTENSLEDASVYSDVFLTESETGNTTENITENTTGNTTETATENAEESTTTEVGSGTVFSNDDLYFCGNGTLIVKGNYKHAITSDDSVFLQEGNYQLSAVKDGVHANEDLVVNGGTIQISSCEEGLESKTNVSINDGIIEINGTDDGINAASALQINGGIVYADITVGDALDSNGTLEINGGIVLALGGNVPEGGADCDANAFSISGGTLIATGGVNSSPTESACKQRVVLLGAAAKGDNIGIKDADGKTVFAFQVPKAYSNLMLSGEFLQTDGTYTVYTGGTISGGENSYGYYANAEYEGGTESINFTTESMIISAGGTAGMQGGGMHGDGMKGDGMRDGKGHMNKEWPEGMTPPTGEMPEGMTPPTGEMPEGMTPPTGEMPEGMTPPTGGMPEGMTPPTGEAQEGMTPPTNDTQENISPVADGATEL